MEAQAYHESAVLHERALVSIAISLKRIADALTSEPTLAQSVSMAITEGIWNANRSTNG